MRVGLLAAVVVLLPVQVTVAHVEDPSTQPLHLFVYVDYSGLGTGQPTQKWKRDLVRDILHACKHDDHLSLIGFNKTSALLWEGPCESTTHRPQDARGEAKQDFDEALLQGNSQLRQPGATEYTDFSSIRIQWDLQRHWWKHDHERGTNPDHVTRVVLFVTDGIHDPDGKYPQGEAKDVDAWNEAFDGWYRSSAPRPLDHVRPNAVHIDGLKVELNTIALVGNQAFCDSEPRPESSGPPEGSRERSRWYKKAVWRKLRGALEERWAARTSDLVLEGMCPAEAHYQASEKLARHRARPVLQVHSYSTIEMRRRESMDEEPRTWIDMSLNLRSTYAQRPQIGPMDLRLKINGTEVVEGVFAGWQEREHGNASGNHVALIHASAEEAPDQINRLRFEFNSDTVGRRFRHQGREFEVHGHVLRGSEPGGAPARARTVRKFATMEVELDPQLHENLGGGAVIVGRPEIDSNGHPRLSFVDEAQTKPCTRVEPGVDRSDRSPTFVARIELPKTGNKGWTIPVQYWAASSARSMPAEVGDAAKPQIHCQGLDDPESDGAISLPIRLRTRRYDSSLFYTAVGSLSTASLGLFLGSFLVALPWPRSRVRRPELIERKVRLEAAFEIVSVVAVLGGIAALATYQRLPLNELDWEFSASFVGFFLVVGFAAQPRAIARFFFLAFKLWA